MPNVVTFEDGTTVTYTYAADGTKLRTLHNINGTTTQKDYCGSVIYENGAAKLWQTEAGYISMNDSKYHYYLQDHQGNNRVVVNEAGATEEINHYYAFGGLFDNSNSVQPFKYNGKELVTQKGLNWYDYGARQYDATLGRFISADPSAENYYDTGIYAYCGSNPINRIDPTGADWYQDDKGNYRWQRGSDNLKGYTNIGSTVSLELGENSFLNFYQNGGIWANQAVNAIDLIYASPKLQDQFLGYGSVLSDDDQIALIKALNFKRSATLIKPLALEALSWAAGGLGGKLLGKAIGWGLGKTSIYFKGSYISSKVPAQFTSTYTKSNLKLGQEMHKAYKINDVIEGVAIKEFRGIKGIRPDFVDFSTRTIYELKPNNPRAIKQGWNQLNKYQKAFQQEYGGEWKTVLDLY